MKHVGIFQQQVHYNTLLRVCKLLYRYGVSSTAMSLLFRNLVAPSIPSDTGGTDDGVEPPFSGAYPRRSAIEPIHPQGRFQRFRERHAGTQDPKIRGNSWT